MRRLSGKKEPSLADSPALAGVGADRDDALLLFFVNAKPLIPFIKQAMASEGSGHELALAQAILDIDSLQSLTGRVGIGEDGIGIDIALRLNEGHHNLVFNFLRTPAINRDTLQCIPGGAAAFLVGALNEAPSRFGATPSSTTALPIVTALDLGRELFANITSLALYVLPPDETGTKGGFPMPDVGLAITVNDPSKSEALWTQFLGLANMASGTGGMEGTPVTIEGAKVRTFRMPEGPVIHFATLGHDVVITSSASAMARSIHSKKKGASVLDDPAFAQSHRAFQSAQIDLRLPAAGDAVERKDPPLPIFQRLGYLVHGGALMRSELRSRDRRSALPGRQGVSPDLPLGHPN